MEVAHDYKSGVSDPTRHVAMYEKEIRVKKPTKNRNLLKFNKKNMK
jgi:hypothetical protein